MTRWHNSVHHRRTSQNHSMCANLPRSHEAVRVWQGRRSCREVQDAKYKDDAIVYSDDITSDVTLLSKASNDQVSVRFRELPLAGVWYRTGNCRADYGPHQGDARGSREFQWAEIWGKSLFFVFYSLVATRIFHFKINSYLCTIFIFLLLSCN